MFGLLSQLDINAPQFSRGTAERFTELYKQYLPKVFRYMTYRVADVHVAEDLTSIVFEKALTKFKSQDTERASFSTWLFTIARNTVIDHYRASGKQKSLENEGADFAFTENASPEDNAVQAEEFRMLQSFVSRLSQSEQEIISLKFGAGMNNRQIAKTTGLSESNVGTIIWRAVGKLRDNFRELGNG